jgi:hypothetical protein
MNVTRAKYSTSATIAATGLQPTQRTPRHPRCRKANDATRAQSTPCWLAGSLFGLQRLSYHDATVPRMLLMAVISLPRLTAL